MTDWNGSEVTIISVSIEDMLFLTQITGGHNFTQGPFQTLNLAVDFTKVQ
jgi:hypothetical protein